MAIPTLQNVWDAARGHLGDDGVSGGQIFTNTVLTPHSSMAFRELWRVMASVGTPRVRKEKYYLLGANTSYLDPATAGITDMGEPEWVEERTLGGSAAISAFTAATSPTVTTSTPHGLNTGDYAIIGGTIAGLTTIPYGQYAVTVIDATSFTLNGAISVGTWSSGGTVYRSTEEWRLVWPPVDSIPSVTTGNGVIVMYAWMGDIFQFPPTTGQRQLRITYLSSGAAPTSANDSIGIDDSLDFLAARTAGLAADSRGGMNRAATLNALAIGPGTAAKADGSDGLLNQFLLSIVRGMQRQRYVRPRYGQWPNKDFAVFSPG
jgi:hypothetical protein